MTYLYINSNAGKDPKQAYQNEIGQILRILQSQNHIHTIFSSHQKFSNPMLHNHDVQVNYP